MWYVYKAAFTFEIGFSAPTYRMSDESALTLHTS